MYKNFKTEQYFHFFNKEERLKLDQLCTAHGNPLKVKADCSDFETFRSWNTIYFKVIFDKYIRYFTWNDVTKKFSETEDKRRWKLKFFIER